MLNNLIRTFKNSIVPGSSCQWDMTALASIKEEIGSQSRRLVRSILEPIQQPIWGLSSLACNISSSSNQKLFLMSQISVSCDYFLCLHSPNTELTKCLKRCCFAAYEICNTFLSSWRKINELNSSITNFHQLNSSQPNIRHSGHVSHSFNLIHADQAGIQIH